MTKQGNPSVAVTTIKLVYNLLFQTIMARELEKLVDFKILESETQKACEADKLYWIRNDAKIRAATGKPIEYEEFRYLNFQVSMSICQYLLKNFNYYFSASKL